MRRREFLGLIGAAGSWPLTGWAQSNVAPVVGFLHSGAPDENIGDVEAFLKGLKEAGYIEGENVSVAYRWANDQYDLIHLLAADLVARKVQVIFTGGGASVALTVKAATSSLPIVFTHGSDAVKVGLVANLNRPSGNVTGVTWFNSALQSKRLQLLRDAIPHAKIIGALTNARSMTADNRLPDLKAAGAALGIKVEQVGASSPDELEAAFERLSLVHADGLLVVPDPLFRSIRRRIAELAMQCRVPTLSSSKEAAEAGGLMSYGNKVREAFRQGGVYTGRLLKGAKPGDLPVIQSDAFELVLNLRTAKALGIEFAPTLLAQADEVIE